jgi:hypothetical protein
MKGDCASCCRFLPSARDSGAGLNVSNTATKIPAAYPARQEGQNSWIERK